MKFELRGRLTSLKRGQANSLVASQTTFQPFGLRLHEKRLSRSPTAKAPNGHAFGTVANEAVGEEKRGAPKWTAPKNPGGPPLWGVCFGRRGTLGARFVGAHVFWRSIRVRRLAPGGHWQGGAGRQQLLPSVGARPGAGGLSDRSHGPFCSGVFYQLVE